MANGALDAATNLVTSWTPTTYSVVALLIVFVGTLIKVWPLIKAKLNEARKIELDADADFRGDLLTRVKELEESRDDEPVRIEAAISAERRRCDAELARRDADTAEMRLDLNRRIDQLMRVIVQDSQSRARLLDVDGKLGSDGK